MNPPDKTNPADHKHDDKRRVTQAPEKSADGRERADAGTSKRANPPEESRPDTGDDTHSGAGRRDAEPDEQGPEQRDRPTLSVDDPNIQRRGQPGRDQQAKTVNLKKVQDAEHRGMSGKGAESDGS
jgi:hypothetical protein